MGLTSLRVCMDSSDWLQGTINEESEIDCSPLSGDMLTCSRLRPPHEEAVKCPRCESTHTKFCYYNNYSLSQPRYLCKTCRRYWTKGGTLRNIPVGGGCRKKKKVSSQKPSPSINIAGSSTSHNPTHLQLANFPEMHLNNANFMWGSRYSSLLEYPMPIDSAEGKLESIAGKYDLMRNNTGVEGVGEMGMGHGLWSPPYGMSLDGTFMDRLMLPYDANEDDQDVKPNDKLLSLDWKDQGYSDAAYINSLGSWSGMMQIH